MKRKALIAGITAAVLATGGTATAFALTSDDDGVTATRATGTTTVSDNADRTGHDAAAASDTDITAAIRAALSTVPGTATSADLDDDHGTGSAWDIEIQGKDGKETM